MRDEAPPPARPRSPSPEEGSASTWARVVSAGVAFLVAIGVLWAGTPLLVPVYLALSGVAVFEYAAMTRLRGIRVHRTGLLVMTALLLPAAMPDGHPLALFARLGIPGREALLLAFLMGMLGVALARPAREALVTAVYTLLGYLWIPGFLSYALTLRESPDAATGLGMLALPVLANVASDVGGWVVGTSVGRTPLAPVISPGKTVEGAIGGLVLAAIVVPVADVVLHGAAGQTMPLWMALTFALVVAGASQLGDLFESLVKRWAGVKDAGLFLPGQGGVLDRIDSALFSLPVAYLLLSLFGRL